MKSYIINLKQSADRREHMVQEMQKNGIEDYEFVDAVYGKSLSATETEKLFDVSKSEKKYARKTYPAEIGCTLSHQKIYRKVVESDISAAVIYEDDVILGNGTKREIEELEKIIDSKDPMIILLSGMYWYNPWKKRKNRNLVRIFNAYLSSSYIINGAAARAMIEERPYMRADDWRYFIHKGIKIYAVQPHIVDQDWSGSFESTIFEDNGIKKLSLQAMYCHFIALLMKTLKAIGGYEYAGESRVMK